MASQNEWSQFLRRALGGSDHAAAGLHRLFQRGPRLTYGNEFVVQAYHHHQTEALFLAGIPNLRATLPRA